MQPGKYSAETSAGVPDILATSCMDGFAFFGDDLPKIRFIFTFKYSTLRVGAIAQLGERLHGMHKGFTLKIISELTRYAVPSNRCGPVCGPIFCRQTVSHRDPHPRCFKRSQVLATCCTAGALI